MHSLFHENYVSERDPLMNNSNSIVLFTWANRDVYPEGNIKYHVNESPSFRWAFQNHSSGQKTKKNFRLVKNAQGNLHSKLVSLHSHK